MEVWKDIKGYEGLYQISDLGRVKSLSRSVTNSGSFNGVHNVRERILKDANHGKRGYKVVQLSKSGTCTRCFIHRLVGVAFLDYKHGEGFVVDHIDNDPTNNKLDNLQVITKRHNCSKDKKNKKSKYTGVSPTTSNKWCAQIRIDGIQTYLGTYNTEEEARNVYESKRKEIE